MLRVCRHLLCKCKTAVGFGRYGTFPVSPREKFRLHNGQLVLLVQTPPPSSEVFEAAVRGLEVGGEEGVSRWLLILQDEAPGRRWWENAPPLCGPAPLGGGGGSVSGPAGWGSAVGWAGWSQEAGVQGWSHWRSRQVLWQRHVRQPCFYNVLDIIFSKKEEKSHDCLAAATTERSLIGPRSCDHGCLHPGWQTAALNKH